MSVIRSSFAVIKMHHFLASLLLLTSLAISYGEFNIFGGAYIVFRNRFLYGFMFVYIYICQDGGAVGFVDFTKLLFALSSLAQPLK